MRLLSAAVLAGSLLLWPAASSFAAPLDDTSYAIRVLDLTNAERIKVGLPPLRLNAQLSQAAQSYSQVLATTGCFEHDCGDVPDYGDRIKLAGYTGWSALGENIAAGYQTPEAVVAGWMASPGHRANILSDKYTEMGVGLVSQVGDRYGIYWAQEFGRRTKG
jgi:uncharacterized protein YkwD